ncbi:MAG: hypothetical protein ACOH5I_09295 [Oligoflexus sp.]
MLMFKLMIIGCLLIPLVTTLQSYNSRDRLTEESSSKLSTTTANAGSCQDIDDIVIPTPVTGSY